MRAILLTAAIALGLGCQRSAPSTDGAGEATATSQVPSSSAAVSARFEHPNYTVVLEPAGPYKKGESASFKIVVRAKGEFHINEEYPTKFSAVVAPGVAYAMPKLARATQPDAFALKPCASGKDNCTLELTVRFTPEQAGTVTVGGEIALGVCNKDNCIFDKKVLSVAVPVG